MPSSESRVQTDITSKGLRDSKDRGEPQRFKFLRHTGAHLSTNSEQTLRQHDAGRAADCWPRGEGCPPHTCIHTYMKSLHVDAPFPALLPSLTFLSIWRCCIQASHIKVNIGLRLTLPCKSCAGKLTPYVGLSQINMPNFENCFITSPARQVVCMFRQLIFVD
jgi:hypothetical protein